MDLYEASSKHRLQIVVYLQIKLQGHRIAAILNVVLKKFDQKHQHSSTEVQREKELERQQLNVKTAPRQFERKTMHN